MKRDIKKHYDKPGINAVFIDRSISLIMMTDEYNPPDPGDPPPGGMGAPPMQENSFKENPFQEKQ
ncbi:MAG: hypothetical protein JW717_07350 [Marinilabiliaceae bacterium]|nr:hypothetical protein [Marinilabiliaceae bacterium]